MWVAMRSPGWRPGQLGQAPRAATTTIRGCRDGHGEANPLGHGISLGISALRRLLALPRGALRLGTWRAGLRATDGAMRSPNRVHVLSGDGFPHA